MRRTLFILVFLLVGCSSSDFDSVAVPYAAQPATRHAPAITDLTILPDVVTYMEGNGNVDITVEIGFRDTGLDIKALRIRMPDGTSVEFSESFATETGTFTEDFAFPTNQIGAFFIEVRLVDQAGDVSGPLMGLLQVGWTGTQASHWSNRLSGLPDKLLDVVWDGSVFIAVGNGGAIFTSADGITWVTRESGTGGADLNAVAFYGSDIYAVGDEIILRSTDHGASWTVKDRPTESFNAVAVSSTQVVVAGRSIEEWGTAIAMMSEDSGDTWQPVDSWPDEDLRALDLIYRAGMFVAATDGSFGQVAVSSDGKMWSEIEVSDEDAWLHTITHDDSQFILAGWWGEIFTSPDGFNWTQLQTPVENVSYTGAVWNGSRLVLAGEALCYGMGIWICDPQYVPHGLSSTDDGTTWEFFNIDSDYASRGLAWGNGRFVSVGEKPAFDGEGAIYTSD